MPGSQPSPVLASPPAAALWILTRLPKCGRGIPGRTQEEEPQLWLSAHPGMAEKQRGLPEDEILAGNLGDSGRF